VVGAKVYGPVRGDFMARGFVELGRTARVNGNIRTAALVVERGRIIRLPMPHDRGGGSCGRMSLTQQATGGAAGMKRFRKTVVLALLFVCATAPSLVQAQRRVERRFCTVNLVEGAPLKGRFVAADAKSVTIEVDGARKKIGLNDVTSIVFTVPLRLRKADEPASRPVGRGKPPE
jgi:hypothetical protein